MRNFHNPNCGMTREEVAKWGRTIAAIEAEADSESAADLSRQRGAGNGGGQRPAAAPVATPRPAPVKRRPGDWLMRMKPEEFGDMLGETIHKCIRHSVDPLLERIAALEARPELVHRGIWLAGRSYPEASLVTHAGGLWLAQRETDADAKPGAGEDWRLIVKSGGAV